MYAQGVSAALCDLRLEKTGTDRFRKATQRAIMALSGGQLFHGARPEHVQGLLRTGAIHPGPMNLQSPPGVREVYFGHNYPTKNYAGRSLFSVPSSRVVGHTPVVDDVGYQRPFSFGAAYTPPDAPPARKTVPRVQFDDFERPGFSTHLALSPNPVPLARKDTFIPAGNSPAADVAAARKRGMRVIPRQIFAREHARMFGSDPELFASPPADSVLHKPLNLPANDPFHKVVAPTATVPKAPQFRPRDSFSAAHVVDLR